jgi:hypothetical protein
MRRAWGVVLAAVLVGAAGCGDDPEAELFPPGTPLAAGLDVPVGTQLVGPVFPYVVEEESTGTSRFAVLRVDGDPFAAWDDLAAQAQDTGVRMPRSSICHWRSTTADPVTFGPYPDVPVSMSRPDHADAMSCQAGATGPPANGAQVRVEMQLWWWGAGAELHVEISEGGPVDRPAYPTYSERSAPATAVAQLPELAPRPSDGPGSPFGQENNCFETGYGRLTVPGGARLLGGGTTPGLYADFSAVLAVEDPEAVLRELEDQLDDPDETGGDYRVDAARLADGTTVWQLSGSVSAGGGGCGMLSSPDGTAVLVTTRSD